MESSGPGPAFGHSKHCAQNKLTSLVDVKAIASKKEHVVDKPARLIIRLLFGFVSDSVCQAQQK